MSEHKISIDKRKVVIFSIYANGVFFVLLSFINSRWISMPVVLFNMFIWFLINGIINKEEN